MKFLIASEASFGKRRFLFAEVSDKCFALYREDCTVPVYLPYAACKAHRLRDGSVQVQIPHWLHKENREFLK